MPKFRIGWLVPALLAFPALLAAEPLTLAEAERLALAGSPALQAQASRAEALAAVPPQAGSLPDPTLSLAALNLPTDSFSTTQENMTQLQLSISQPLPFPGKLGLKRQAAAQLAEAAASDRDEFRLLLLRNVRIHWWNLAWLNKALAIVRTNQALLRNLVKVSEARYRTGSGLQQDVLLAQLELSRLLERELALESERQNQTAKLNALLGRDSVTAVELPAELPAVTGEMPDTTRLKRQADTNRPLLASLDRQVDAAGSMVALAERDYYPDFRLGAAYGVRHGTNPLGGLPRSDLASITLTMTLPLYSGSKQARAVDQRKAEQATAKFARQDARNQVYAEIDAAAAELRIAREQLQLFRQGIIPQARQTTASMLAGYQVGKVDFLNLIRARLNEFNYDMQQWQLHARAGQAAARLAAAAGMETLDGDSNHE